MKLYDWETIEEEQLNPLISRKVIHGANLTVAQIRLRKGARVPEHRHISEQLSMITEGSLHFLIEGEVKVVKTGEALQIPPNIPHSAEAFEDCVAIDLFSPAREDWIRR